MKTEANPLITDDWLKELGFRWHDVERSQNKHWLLWLGDAVRDGGLTSTEDLGIELSKGYGDDRYFCWLRGDYSHRYSRFIHIRQLRTRPELLRLIEGLTGLDWNPANVWHGALVTEKQAEYFRKERERLDIKFVEGSHAWNESEKDESRGYPLHEHQDFIEGKLPNKQ